MSFLSSWTLLGHGNIARTSILQGVSPFQTEKHANKDQNMSPKKAQPRPEIRWTSTLAGPTGPRLKMIRCWIEVVLKESMFCSIRVPHLAAGPGPALKSLVVDSTVLTSKHFRFDLGSFLSAGPGPALQSLGLL